MKPAPWKWDRFVGSAAALKYARRDLPDLAETVARVPQCRVAVQAGGNLGIFPKLLAAHFQWVYSFEPAPDLFVAMMANAPESNIFRYQAALGFDRGLVGLSRVRRDGKPNAHEGITHVSGAGAVPVLRLDDFALPVCDLIALDLEGFELFALQGAVDTIRRCRPVLAVEVNKNIAYLGHTAEEVRAFIASLGYRQVDRLHSDDVYEPLERAA